MTTTMTLSSNNFRIRRNGKPDATFDGVLLADVSSKDDEPNRERWTEIRIYRTKTLKYIVEIVGRSIVPGDKDRITFNVCSHASELTNALKINNRPYLTALAIEALEIAAEEDGAVAAEAVEAID